MAEFQRAIYLVTGGAGGLGRAVVEVLADANSHVVVVDIGETAQDFAAALREKGLSVSAASCDVSSRDSVVALRDELTARELVPTAVISLAGASRNAPLDRVSEADFDLAYATHARGTLNVMWAFAPAMREQRYGRIVNTSSVAALGSPTGMSYVAAKGAIEAMTRTAAIELARYGITVNCIAPGGIDGGLFRQQPAKAQEQMVRGTPMGRMGQPSEVAACYGFLSSPAASFVTGQTLYVCGGASIGAFL